MSSQAAVLHPHLSPPPSTPHCGSNENHKEPRGLDVLIAVAANDGTIVIVIVDRTSPAAASATRRHDNSGSLRPV
ncbi:hypothetical protein C0Q70_08821 [Pomacea canaliculata]|uniref:Uncharacterized protein n=1 Tax=Pomacea canaliculata TaxID=400727 RepID=A0A2T7P811_POMCA|nr:hypothetical protein C0Q70_08821 [Pomacea canaliculata]